MSPSQAHADHSGGNGTVFYYPLAQKKSGCSNIRGSIDDWS